VTVVLGVRWVARQGEEERVAEILRRLVGPTRAEPGCIQYEPHRDPDDPRVFFLFERFRDEAALKAHEESPHVQELLFGEALGLLEERRRTFWNPLGD
jgi:quinol monooxygenase YgiN